MVRNGFFFLMKKQLIWRRPLSNMTKSASPQVHMAGVDGLGHEMRQSSLVTFDRFLAVWENTIAGDGWCHIKRNWLNVAVTLSLLPNGTWYLGRKKFSILKRPYLRALSQFSFVPPRNRAPGRFFVCGAFCTRLWDAASRACG
jgi:hypothetical protein